MFCKFFIRKKLRKGLSACQAREVAGVGHTKARRNRDKLFPCLKGPEEQLKELTLPIDKLDEEARKRAFDLIAGSVGEILPIRRLRNDHCVSQLEVSTIIRALEELHVSECSGTFLQESGGPGTRLHCSSGQDTGGDQAWLNVP